MKKTIINNMIVVVMVVASVLGVSGLTGCTSADQFNPYALAASVNSADATVFFSEVYDAFLSLGASTDTEEQETTTSTTTTTTEFDTTGLDVSMFQ